MLLHEEQLLHRKGFTQSKLLPRASMCTEKLLHREALTIFYTQQALHKEGYSTTLYHKACTKHVPVLLHSTKLAQ